MQLSLPPYGEIVKSFIRFTPDTSIYIYCGKTAFHDARATIKNATPCLCLPFGRKPDEYQWPVDGGKFIIFDTGGLTLDFLKNFACLLLAHGAKQVVLHTELAPIQLFTQKDLTL